MSSSSLPHPQDSALRSTPNFQLIQKTRNCFQIGNGSIGAKAKLLIESQAAFEGEGILCPLRIVLADSVTQAALSPLRDAHGFGASQAPSSWNIPLHADSILHFAFQELIRRCPDTEIFICRSSAEGDGNGNGQFKSVAFWNTYPSFENAYRQVVSSSMTSSSMLWKQHSKFGDGFGVVLEPFVGNFYKNDGFFAPAISGHCFSAWKSLPDFISLTAGGGCAVETDARRPPLEVTGKEWDEAKGLPSLLAKIEDEYEARVLELYGSGSRIGKTGAAKKLPTLREATLLRSEGNRQLGGDLMRGMYACEAIPHNPASHTQDPRPVGCYLSQLHPQSNTTTLPQVKQLSELLAVLRQRTEQKALRQYAEFALSYNEQGTEQLYLIQVGEIESQEMQQGFPKGTLPLLRSSIVSGSGIQEIHQVAYISGKESRKELQTFNRENSRYLLFVSADYITTQTSQQENGLQFDECNNAAVIIVVPDRHLHETLASHFKGKFRTAHILLSLLPGDETKKVIQAELGGDFFNEAFSSRVVDWKIFASETSSRFEIHKQENLR